MNAGCAAEVTVADALRVHGRNMAGRRGWRYVHGQPSIVRPSTVRDGAPLRCNGATRAPLASRLNPSSKLV